MVRIIYATIFILAITDVRSQFFDFFNAFQQGHTTTRPYLLDVTTRRRTETKVTRHDTRIDSTTKRNYNIEADVHKQKQKQRTIAPVIFDFFGTTAKPVRKTSKSNRNNSRVNSSDKISKDKVTIRPNHRDVDVLAVINNSRENNRQSDKSKTGGIQGVNRRNDDKLIFDNEKNSVISYETSRPNIYDNKRFTTQNPFTIRPGVRPAVMNGPPITNRPPTRKPSFGLSQQDDLLVSPELIIGPNEDYMNTVEKKRYIELAERMCDQYKALDIKQVEAIPLVPSPEPVRINVSSCTPITSPLIVGGRVVSIQEFPHMAVLGWNRVDRSGYSWKCGGSLISNQYVLTAAHCAYQERDDSVIPGTPRAVQLGSSYLDDAGAIVVKVAAVIRHPKYKLPKSYYDIALVKLATTVTFSSVIKPACLGVPPSPGRPVIATGWGRTEFGGDQSQELRSVSLSVWNMDECYSVLGTSRKIPNGPMSESQICAGEKNGGKDTCQGDSGGPAQVQDGCTWRVVAVTSVGRSCGAAHTPALYATVQRSFISAVVFGGQTTSKSTTQPTTQWNNQQNNPNSNNNQQTGWNTASNNNQQWNNNGNNQQNGWNTRSSGNNQNNYNNGRNERDYNYQNQYNQGYTTQKPQQQYNPSYTTTKPNRNYYNDYGSPYQSDQPDYGGRLYWT